jgi:hypothetical protein
MWSNIGGFQMIFAMRIAEELDVDPFNGPSLRYARVTR